MKRPIPALLLLGLALLPTPALASTGPSTLTLRWGLDYGAWSRQPDYSNIPAFSATWPLGRMISLWSGASYFQQSYARFPNLRYLGTSDHSYSGYLPLTFGLRVHAHNAQGQQRGPFVEFGPSLTPAWYRIDTPEGNVAVSSGFALMGGFQAGTGLRIATLDGTQVELGLSYYLAEAFGEGAHAHGRIGTPRQVDVNLLTVYVALGAGD